MINLLLEFSPFVLFISHRVSLYLFSHNHINKIWILWHFNSFRATAIKEKRDIMCLCLCRQWVCVCEFNFFIERVRIVIKLFFIYWSSPRERRSHQNSFFVAFMHVNRNYLAFYCHKKRDIRADACGLGWQCKKAINLVLWQEHSKKFTWAL